MKILLPIDGSEGALDAVREALRLMHGGLRSSFVLANVQEPASLYEIVVAHDAQVIENVSASAAEHELEPARMLLRTAGATFDVDIGHGDPGHLLVDAAERLQVDLVLMGMRGVGDPRGSGLGSVARAVLEASPVAVMLTRPAAE